MRFGYGSLQPAQFVAFRDEFTHGAWKLVATGHSKNGEVPLLKTPVVIVLKSVLVRAVNQLVVAQVASNDGADTRWSQAERRFVSRLVTLTLDNDPAIVAAATTVQATLADGGSLTMVNQPADGKVDFGINQIAMAAMSKIAPLVEQLGLGDALDDIRTCTDELKAAIGRGEISTGNVPRSRRIAIANTQCAAAFNWVHEGLALLRDRTDDGAARAELDALIAPLEALLARKLAPVAVVEDPQPDTATPVVAPAVQQPLAHTG